MKICIIMVSLMNLSHYGMSQSYWTKTYDPFGHKFEDVRNIIVEDSTIYASCRGLCSKSIFDECFKISKFTLDGAFISGIEDHAFETGYGMELDENWIYVDGGNEPFNTEIIINRLSKDFVDQTSLASSFINSTRLINESLFATPGHVIAFGSYRNSTEINEDGSHHVHGVQVWVNKTTFETDTVVHLSPTSSFRVIHDMVWDGKDHVYSVGGDSQMNENGIELTYAIIVKQDLRGQVVDEFTFPVILKGRSGYYSSMTVVNGNLVFRGATDDLHGYPNIICIDTLGHKLWEHQYKEYRDMTPFEVLTSKNNQVFVLGLTQSVEFGWADVPFITCLNSSTGEVLWERVYEIDKGQDPYFPGYAKFSRLYDLEQVDNGDLYVAGYIDNLYDDPDLGLRHDKDLWLMKLDSMGCLTPDCGYVQSIQNGVVMPDTCKWLEDDAKWYYTPWAIDFQERIAKIEILDDTLIGNRLCSVLGMYEEDEFVANSELIVFYERENDKVYFYENDTFKLMYNFSYAILPGDTVEYSLPQKLEYYDITSSQGSFLPPSHSLKYRYIDQEWVTTHDGEQLRIVITKDIPTSDNQECCSMDQIIDGIGSRSGLLGRAYTLLPGGAFGLFRCFESNTLNYSEVEGNCLITSSENIIASELVKVYPNPSFYELQIDTEIPFDRLRILDPSGRLVMQDRYKSTMPIDNLYPGIYFLELMGEEGLFMTKVIKGR